MKVKKQETKKTHCYFLGSATMKNGDQTCLNPDSADVKELIKEWEKQVGDQEEQNFLSFTN